MQRLRNIVTTGVVAVALAIPGVASAQGPRAPFSEQHDEMLQKLDEVIEAIKIGDQFPCGGGTFQRFVLSTDGTDGTEVCDNTTGLVWEQEPSNSLPSGLLPTWDQAISFCPNEVGAEYRLPEVKELISLVDYSQVGRALPAGHPFTFSNVQFIPYWSAATVAKAPLFAWVVDFGRGSMFNSSKDNDGFVTWCVRDAS